MVGRSIVRWGGLIRRSSIYSRSIQIIDNAATGVLQACGDQAKHHERGRKGPRSFLEEISRALHAADLLGTGETGRQATALGVLRQNYQREKTTDDEDDDGDGDHDYLFS